MPRTFGADNRTMTNDIGIDPPADARPTDPLDPQRVLETLATELELLTHEVPSGSALDLVRLHGALLVYDLDDLKRLKEEIMPKVDAM